MLYLMVIFLRSTVDIDFLAKKITNDAQKLYEVFREIFAIEVDDALRFDLNTLKVKNITEFKKYHGVNISVFSYLDRIEIPVSIDIGFDDIVYPDYVKMDFPALLNMPVPKINAYSIYSVISEKFEAIVSLGLVNSRYKDFYDIYQIASTFELDSSILRESLLETFNHRGTSFNDVVAFDEVFVKDPIRIKQWKAFIKKKKVIDDVDLSEVILLIKTLLLPIIDSINKATFFNGRWDKKNKRWLITTT